MFGGEESTPGVDESVLGVDESTPGVDGSVLGVEESTLEGGCEVQIIVVVSVKIRTV